MEAVPPASPEDADASEDTGQAEIQAIYVDPDRFGRGIGRTLLGRAMDELRATGFRDVVLWVLEGNDRARRFYEAAGWRTDGGTKLESMEGADLSEVRVLAEAEGTGRSAVEAMPQPASNDEPAAHPSRVHGPCTTWALYHKGFVLLSILSKSTQKTE
jgi:hypothetical protein